jgi:2-hydroxychromene-2-carboxylate isomerase
VNRTEQPITFYFDVGSPYAYLAAERIERVLPSPVEWQPILLGGIFKLTGRSSWALGDFQSRRRGMAEIERRATHYGLPPLRWPDPWPDDYLAAMRVATWARTQGRGRDYALSALRSAFAGGRHLGDLEALIDAAAEAGLDRAAARAALDDRSVKDELRAATAEAHARGVYGVPTVAAGGELFWGDDRLEDAAARVRDRVG